MDRRRRANGFDVRATGRHATDHRVSRGVCRTVSTQGRGYSVRCFTSSSRQRFTTPGLRPGLDGVPGAAKWRRVGKVEIADASTVISLKRATGGDVDALGDLGVAVAEQLEPSRRPDRRSPV